MLGFFLIEVIYLKLKEFVEKFICPNSLIRLWKPLPKEEGYGHEMLRCEDREVGMNHAIIKNKGWQSIYNDYEVIGVNDIYCDGFYREAINIVIKC